MPITEQQTLAVYLTIRGYIQLLAQILARLSNQCHYNSQSDAKVQKL